MHRVVLTGGPGAGKTTVLSVLGTRGYATGNDAARTIIRERKASGLSPRPAAAVFAEQVLQREIESYRSLTQSPVFFERGIAEAAASLVEAGALDVRDATRLITEYRYDQVFIFPPWEDIYCMDEERDHTFDHAIRVYGAIHGWYERHNYELIEVPIGSPQARCDFILAEMEGHLA